MDIEALRTDTAAAELHPACITLLHTQGTGSFELYAGHLAKRVALSYPTRFYEDTVRRYRDAPPISKEAAAALADEARLIWQLRKLGPVHLPNQHLARYVPFLRAPAILTVHDLMRFNGDLIDGTPNRRQRLYLEADMRGIRSARHIIAVSAWTKRNLLRAGIPAERITVVHNGVDHSIFKPSMPAELPRYILYVGTEQPRKNLPRLLAALRLLRQQEDITLIKVGRATVADRAVTEAAAEREGVANAVLFFGYVRERILPHLYSGAEALVMPSLAEGFGLPVLEALACGCPVVTSRRGSLEEVAGHAAFYADPTDPRDIAAAIFTAMSERRTAAEAGIAHARGFSWDRCAAETEEVYLACR